MSTDTLAPQTHMGRLELRVHDLATELAFYTDGVGLEPISDEPGAVTLGHGGTPIVRLTESRDLRPARGGEAGLFHTAVVYDDPKALARVLVSMFQKYPENYTGTGDHLVSEAFYFTDPEGNGLELYRDRPRHEWTYDAAGTLQSATLPLDPNQFLARHLGTGTAGPAEVGHVHLQVGDIATARGFYVDVLGFDVTMDYGSALFVSAGGYHHHLAMNTWGTRGAGPRAASLGLGEVAIDVPTRDDVAALAERVRAAGLSHGDDGRTLTVADPWGTRVRVRAAA